jgi:hypothetical protein
MQRERMKKARHDMGNALSIAQASVEAMLDGVVGITDPRLNRLRELLASVSDAMYELTANADVAPVSNDEVAAQVDELVPVAQTKGVRIIYESSSGSEPVKNALLKALRDAPANSIVRVVRSDDGHVIIRTELSTKDS